MIFSTPHGRVSWLEGLPVVGWGVLGVFWIPWGTPVGGHFFFRNDIFSFSKTRIKLELYLVQIRCKYARPNPARHNFKLPSRQKYLDSGPFLETPRLLRHKAQDARLSYISNAKLQKPKS